jgi:quercetin dioxygenase-like cupin family protein
MNASMTKWISTGPLAPHVRAAQENDVMKPVRQRLIALLVFCVMVVGTAGIAVSASDEATPETPHAVVREVLVAGRPDTAPGKVLELVRYTIPPHTLLPVHIHPGMQTAFVESGTLHYTVVEGSAAFTRANGESGELTRGQETDLEPGDTIVETQGMVHFGDNRGDEEVILLVASLFQADVPPSSLVVVATPVATPEG